MLFILTIFGTLIVYILLKVFTLQILLYLGNLTMQCFLILLKFVLISLLIMGNLIFPAKNNVKVNLGIFFNLLPLTLTAMPLAAKDLALSTYLELPLGLALEDVRSISLNFH